MKIEEIKTKEEFLDKLSKALVEIDEFNKKLDAFPQKMQDSKMMLNLMLNQTGYDEENHKTVQKCFDEFNDLKKEILKIEKRRNAIREILSFTLFKKYYVDSHDYTIKAIELKDNIDNHKKLVNEQIIKCIDYFNMHEVKITL